MNLGAPELIVILLIILLIFGGAKRPQLARSLGQAKHEFEKGASEGKKNDAEPADKKDDA